MLTLLQQYREEWDPGSAGPPDGASGAGALIVPTATPPSASPTEQPGFVTAMEACVRDNLGKSLDLREMRLPNVATLTGLELPSERREELERVLEGGSEAGYGITIEGGTAIVHVPAAPDAQTHGAAAALCYLQFISVHGGIYGRAECPLAASDHLSRGGPG